MADSVHPVRRADIVVLIALAAIVIFPALGQTHHLASREIRHAEIIREIAESNDFFVPRLLGEVYRDKPPVMHAVAAVLVHWAGKPSMFLNRLPSAVAGILGVLATYGLGVVLYERRVGLCAAIALLGIPGYTIMARVARPDMILCTAILGSCLALARGMREQRHGVRTLYFLLAGAACGLGVVTKGPYGILVPILFAAFAPIRRPDWKRPHWGWIGFLCGLFALAAIWVVPVFLRDHGQYLRSMLVQPDLDVTVEEKSRVFLVYLWQGLAYSMPLALFLPLALYDLRRAYSAPLTVAGAIFLIISCVPKKRPHYLLPLYPFLALGIAESMVRHGQTSQWVRRSMWVLLSIGVLSVPIYYGVALPRLHPQEDGDLYLARQILPHIETGATVYCVKTSDEAIAWVAQRTGLTKHFDDRNEASWSAWIASKNAYLLIPENRWRKLRESHKAISFQEVLRCEVESETVLLLRIQPSATGRS